MVTQYFKQKVQAFFESNGKFSDRSSGLTSNQKGLSEKLESIVYCKKLSSDDHGANQVNSDRGVIRRLKDFLDDNQDNRDLKFVLNLKRGTEESTVLHDFVDVDIEVVDLLLKAGVDSSIQDKEGKTPLQIAINNYCYSAIGLFFNEKLERLPDKQKELNKELLNLLSDIEYVSEREKFNSEYSVNSDSVAALKKFLDHNEKENSEDLKAVLNLQRGEFGSTVLHDVQRLFYTETVNLFLKAGADPKIQDVEGKSPLRYAFECNYGEAAKSLLNANKDNLNSRDENGRTPLHYAVKYNCIEAVRSLLDSNEVDVNIQDIDGKSAIECVIDSACEDCVNIYYYPHIIELLVEAGADPNAQSQGQRVLDIVITATEGFNKEECIKVAKLLIKKGADINLRDELFGRTLLHHAAADGRENIVELLLQSTEDKERTQLINAQDDNGNTPLHCAVENAGYSNVVELLLAYGADYKIVNKRSLLSRIKGEDTPLHVASQKSDRRNIESFFGKVDINVKNGDGATPLLIASRFGSAAIIESFLEHDANAHAKDKHDNTALHYAANHEHTNNDEECNQLFDESNRNGPEDDNEVEDNAKIIQSLIEKGVDVNDKNEYGHTPLFFAVEHRKCSNAELFLKNGADVNIADENGFTVFHFAIKNRCLELLKILLPKIVEKDEYGSPVTDRDGNQIGEIDTEKAKALLGIRDKEGNTLLHHAVKWGCSEEVLDFLVKNGVDINAKNNNGVAAIHISAKYGKPSQIEFFIKNKADLNVQCGYLSSSLINDIGKEKELSGDADYIKVQDSTVNVNNTEHTNATSLGIVTEDSNSSNVTTLLSAGAKPSIADSRNWLPLHIAIKRASEDGCIEEEREERLEIVWSLASVSHVESLVSQGIDKRSEIWKDQFFKEVKNSLTDALEVTDNEKVQKEVVEAFRDLMLQVTRNKEEIYRVLRGAVEARNGEKSPNAPVNEEASAPVFDDDFYSQIGSHVRKPTLYPNLDDDWMDAWDLQADHSGLQHQGEVTAEEILARECEIKESAWGWEGDIPENSGAPQSWDIAPQKNINSWENAEWDPQADHSELQYQGAVTAEEIADGLGYVDNSVSICSSKKLTEQEKNLLSNQAKGLARENSFKLTLHQQEKLNKFLDVISKTRNMTQLYEVVNAALKSGVRLNSCRNGGHSFTDLVISQINSLNGTKQDHEITSNIVCKLIAKGAIFKNYNKINDELEKSFKSHRTDAQKANSEFSKRIGKFHSIVRGAISHGKLHNLEIDNTTFYLEYSEDGIVDVAKVIDGAKSLGLNQGNIAFGGNIIKIGESEVEIELEDGIRDYTDISDGSDVILTFHTGLGKLEVRLYSDTQNKDIIKVEVCDREKFNQLVSNNEKIGNCLLGGYYVCDAIEQGYFERSGSGKFQSSETINLSENVMEKASEIVKSLNPSDITVNSSVNDVPLSKVSREKNQKIALGG